MAKEFTQEDDSLLAELGVEVEVKKAAGRLPREERILAGFEEIQRFVENHGRPPAHGEDNDIFERLYATRLDQVRKREECRTLLQDLDHQGLLAPPGEADMPVDDMKDDELLSRLGVSAPSDKDVTQLRHVKPRVEVRAAEEIAYRTRCEDFEKYKPLFEAIQNDLDTGVRETKKFRKGAGFLKSDIKKGQFFILGGQVAYVASVGDLFKTPNDATDARLRVIYSNSTESDILLRSMQRALYKDETSRLVSDPGAGPFFSSIVENDDLPSGVIYVLRSKSDRPGISENRAVLHKIGVTGGDVQKRIANARHDPTFLLAEVELVATYELYNINRTRLENILHRFFETARLDIEIKDRFGHPVVPREWFLVPLFIIDEAVNKIKDGTIGDYIFDIKNVELKWRNADER